MNKAILFLVAVVTVVLSKVLYDVTYDVLSGYGMLISLLLMLSLFATMFMAVTFLAVTVSQAITSMLISIAQAVMQCYQFIATINIDVAMKRVKLEREKIASQRDLVELQIMAERGHIVTLSDKQAVYDVTSGNMVSNNVTREITAANSNVTQPLPMIADLKSDSEGIIVGYDTNGTAARRKVFKLSHMLVCGQSGSGKSVLALSLAYQIAKYNLADIATIDLEDITFNAIKPSVIASVDTVSGAELLLQDTVAELERRKSLFSAYPLVDKLDEYNAVSGAGLRPRVLMIDEFTSLMTESKSLESMLSKLLWRARKYGIYIFAYGQSVKFDILDTSMRSQFNTRCLLRHEVTAARAILGNNLGEYDVTKLADGECLVKFADLPSVVKLQGQYLDKATVYNDLLATAKPAEKLELVEQPDSLTLQIMAIVQSLQAEGKSVNPSVVNKMLGRTVGGKQNEQVKTILANLNVK